MHFLLHIRQVIVESVRDLETDAMYELVKVLVQE